MISLERVKVFDWNLAVPTHAKVSLSSLINDLSDPMLLKHSIVDVDENGFICGFIPQSGLSWEAIWFINTLMIEQRLAKMDQIIAEHK